jgi:hypothetical protein
MVATLQQARRRRMKQSEIFSVEGTDLETKRKAKKIINSFTR